MSDNISLGKNGNIGKIDLSRIKAGVKKEDIAKNDKRLESVFDMVDKNNDGILDREELNKLQDKIHSLAGNDRNLDSKEVKNFNGQELGRKDRKTLLKFLNKLDGVTPEDVTNVKTILIDNEKVEVVTFKDGHTEEYYPNGQKTTEYIGGNKKTRTTEMNGTTTSEVVIENEGKDNEITTTSTNINGQRQTIINNLGEKSTTTINYKGDKKTDTTIIGENSKTIITYDDKGNPEKEVETCGSSEKIYTYENGQKILKHSTENKGLESKENSKTYDKEGGYTQTQKIANGEITTIVDKDGNVISKEKTEIINGKKVSIQLDKDGNIPGVIVQNGESPAVIAKKFGCSVDELMDINKDQLKGKDKNKYFYAGAEIKLPNSVSIEKYEKASERRKSAEVVKAEYARDAEIRRQKIQSAKQENEYYQKLGIKNFNNKGKKVQAEFRGGKKANVEIIGKLGYERQLVKLGNKLYTMSHDRKLLDEGYLQAHKAFVNKPKNQRNNTASGIKNVTFEKDKNGKVWYFNEKTGKAFVKKDYTQIVKQESTFIANQLHTAATKTLGTDEKLLEKGVNNIYSREILKGVNAELKSKDIDYAGDAQTMPVEALILDEMSHKAARPLFKTLINSGTMTTQEQAHTVKREIEHEVHGGLTGYTSTSDLNETMQLCSDRKVRLEVEAQFKKDYPELTPNKGSVVRSYIAGDGWNAQEVDLFDANWVKTGAYQEARYVKQINENGAEVLDKNGKTVYMLDKGDQEHRNGVIERLVFNYQNKEALNKGLDVINENPNSFDYKYLNQRAGQEIAKDPKNKYQSRFTNQDNVQRYLAGFHSDKTGKVATGEVSASNTCLYKGVKTARVLAEEALYNAKNGDYSKTFDSMDVETYSAMSVIIANGDIKGVQNMTDLYNKALKEAKVPNDKTKIKANAMLSGQINFTNEQIADFCIDLMHNIDENKGRGGSTGMSAGYTNSADYQTEQLKAILQNNPQVMSTVKSRVEKENFSYTTTIQTGGVAGQPPIVNTFTTNTKDKYIQLLADTKTIAKEEVFYDANGKKITNKTQIDAIKQANMQSLEQMRQYVAELERDFKKGVDAEGSLSDAGNSLLKYSGIGTDREDVATEYRNAKLMLQQFEAAAQGKLRDSQGKVVSAQNLAKQMIDKQNTLAKTNIDYKQSVTYAKIGIVMAPVIAATTVASGGVALGAGAAAGAGMTTTATVLGSGYTTAVVGGVAAGATTYGMNALEYNTSYTGNTAEAREQNLQDSIVNGVATGTGIGQMKYIGNIANNMGTVARTGIRLGATVAADTAVGASAESITTGDITTSGIATNMIMSGVGNAIGAKTLGKKQVASTAKQFTYDNTFKHQDAAIAEPTIAHNSTVKVKDTKNIDAKTDELIKTTNNGEKLANAHNELDALTNRSARRTNQVKIDEKAKTLSQAEQTKFEESITRHHKTETEHTFQRHNELSKADFRTISNSIKDAKTSSDLISLRQNLKQKEYNYGGVTAEYKALEDQIDKKLAHMIQNAGIDGLNSIKKQLGEMKSQVQNDARLASSLEKLNNVIANRSAFLQDQKTTVERLLQNGKGIANNNELDQITSYIQTLDSEQAINALDILRRNKKMTGQQKKVLDNAIANKKAEFIQEQKNIEVPAKKLDEQKTNNANITQKVEGQNITKSPLTKEQFEKIKQLDIEVSHAKTKADLLPIENTIKDMPDCATKTNLQKKIESYRHNLPDNTTPFNEVKVAPEREVVQISTAEKLGKHIENKELISHSENVNSQANIEQHTSSPNRIKPIKSKEEAIALYDKLVPDTENSNFMGGDGFVYEVYPEYRTTGINMIDMDNMLLEADNPWKIHIYADSQQEWANAAQVAMPYLQENKVIYKTMQSMSDEEFNIMRTTNNGTQKGKAFTVYFRSEEEFLQTAKALETRFKESGLKSSGTVSNEAQIGESGFLSYRHKSAERGVQYKPDNIEDPYLKKFG